MHQQSTLWVVEGIPALKDHKTKSLRAYGDEQFYLRDLPIHKSQREVEQGDGYTDFEYIMRPTIDLSGHLLSYGNRIKVLEPQWLAEEIHDMHLHAVLQYEEPENE